MKTTVCLMCGGPFTPTGEEHVCKTCDEEVDEMEHRINGPKDIRPPDEPTDLVGWLWYVKRYESGIYVREQNPSDGKWYNARLSELPPDRWAHHVARWLDEGRLPVRVREEEELMESKNKA